MLLLILFSCARNADPEADSGASAVVEAGTPEARFEPAILDFGEQDVFDSRTLSLLVHNDGDGDL